MKDYNIIWIDDEWKDQSEFKDECEELHIHLKPFSNQKSGMDELDNHPNFWDAVILDGEIKDKSDNEVPSTKGLLNAIKRLSEMPANKRVPYFISTGKDKVKENEMLEDETIYRKGDDDERLIDDIRNTVDNIERFKVKILYKDVIEQFSKISSHASNVVLDIFESMHYPDSHPDFNPILYYNQLRQILEYVFRAANKVAIIPDKCISDSDEVNLNQCCHYLSGNCAKHLEIRYGTEGDRVVPKHIQDMMFLILSIGNINSHTSKLSEEDKCNLTNYIKDNVYNSRYLIYGLALQLCEIVMWMNRYILDHPNREENLKKCMPWSKNEPENQTIDKTEQDTKRLLGAINKEKSKVYSYDLEKNIIIDKKNGFKKNYSPKEYDYAENEKVHFELKEQINPKTNSPFSFAINIVPLQKE